MTLIVLLVNNLIAVLTHRYDQILQALKDLSTWRCTSLLGEGQRGEPGDLDPRVPWAPGPNQLNSQRPKGSLQSSVHGSGPGGDPGGSEELEPRWHRPSQGPSSFYLPGQNADSVRGPRSWWELLCSTAPAKNTDIYFWEEAVESHLVEDCLILFRLARAENSVFSWKVNGEKKFSEVRR